MDEETSRIVRRVMIFNNRDKKPPGWKENEEKIETAINRLGVAMINDVPVVGVTALHFIRNESIMTDDDLNTRIGVYFLTEPVENDKLVLRVKADEHGPRKVTTSDIKTIDGRPAPIVRDVFITVLPPGKILDIELLLEEGTAALNGGRYAVVTNFGLYRVEGDNYRFVYTLVRSFEDYEYVYDIASKVVTNEFMFDPDELEEGYMDLDNF